MLRSLDHSSTALEWIALMEEGEAAGDPWPLILSLPHLKKPREVRIVANILSRFPPDQLDFFMPQLGQICIDQGRDVALPLVRFLVHLARQSTRSGLLLYFIFNAAVDDHYDKPGQHEWNRSILREIEVALTATHYNGELVKLLAAYQEHVNSTAPRSAVDSLAGLNSTPRLDRSPSRSTQLTAEQLNKIQQKVESIVKGSDRSRTTVASTTSPGSGVGEGQLTTSAPTASTRTTSVTPPSLLKQNLLASTGGSSMTPAHSSGRALSATAPVAPPRKSERGSAKRARQSETPPGSDDFFIIEDDITSPQRVATSPLFSFAPLSHQRARQLDALADSVVQLTAERRTSSTPSSGSATEPYAMSAEMKDVLAIHQSLRRLGEDPSLLPKGPVLSDTHDSTPPPASYHTTTTTQRNTHADSTPATTDDSATEAHSAIPTDSLSASTPPLTSLPPPSPLSLSQNENFLPLTSPAYIAEEELKNRELRKAYIGAQLRLIRGLTDISTLLVECQLKDKDSKNAALRQTIQLLNRGRAFCEGVYIPVLDPAGTPVKILRIPSSESLALNSRDRVPYLLLLEVSNSLPVLQPSSSSTAGTLNVFDEDGAKTPDHPLSAAADPSPTEPLPDSTPFSLSLNDDDDGQVMTKITSEFKIIDDWVEVEVEPAAPILGTPPARAVRNSLADKAFGLDWPARKEKVRNASPMGEEPGWDLISVIVKSGDDLRQEQLAMQIIMVVDEVFTNAGLPLWLNPYLVLATSGDAGLIETVHDASSVDGLKKSLGFDTLSTYFVDAYGPTNTPKHTAAITNFVHSLAAYSLVCYLLQIKDRHNGNIMLTREGHVIHIDYGFILNRSVGNLKFESAPFKLPLEFVDLMGGKESDLFTMFTHLMYAGFIELRKHHHKILFLVEAMKHCGNGALACFAAADDALDGLRERFQLDKSEDELIAVVDDLVSQSMGNWSTGVYDRFQTWQNGIL